MISTHPVIIFTFLSFFLSLRLPFFLSFLILWFICFLLVLSNSFVSTLFLTTISNMSALSMFFFIHKAATHHHARGRPCSRFSYLQRSIGAQGNILFYFPDMSSRDASLLLFSFLLILGIPSPLLRDCTPHPFHPPRKGAVLSPLWSWPSSAIRTHQGSDIIYIYI